MILLFPIVAMLVPAVQIWLLRLGYRGNHRAIALVMFVPGIWLWLSLLDLMCRLHRPVDDLGDVMYFAIGQYAYVYYVLLTITTVFFVRAWMGFKETPRKNLRHPEEIVPVPRVRNSCGWIFFAITAATLYLGNYATLEDAVKADNLELARRRLSFNLLGRGANDGGVGEPLSSGGPRSYPLLPIAVYHSNREMVDLLLEHGANLTPRHWKDSTPDSQPLSIDNGVIQHNTLYYAIKNANRLLLNYLLDRGADPTQGVSLAVYTEDTELLADLLRRGGDPNQGLDSALADDPVMLEYLLQMGADRSKAVKMAVSSRRMNSLAYLMTFGVEMDEIRAACEDCSLPLDELDAWVQQGCDLSNPWIKQLSG